VNGDREAAAATMREHATSSMQRAIERLEPILKARKTHGKTYSRNPKKQFSVGAAAGGAANPSLPADAAPAAV
jgi:hypothetical protein